MSEPFFVTSEEDFVPFETWTSMSGLEFMQSMLSGENPMPSICRPMGFALSEVEEGRVCFEGAPTIDHMNPMGTVHGGWYGTLLDSSMGCAVMSKLPTGSYYTTLEYKVNLTRGLKIGTPVITEGIVTHFGRSTAVATGTLIGKEDGKLYASGTTTCLVMQK